MVYVQGSLGVRFSYCRFDKDKLEFNEVRKAAKVKYPTLNTRQVSDAVLQGQTYQKVFLRQQEALAEKKTEIEGKLKKKLSAKKKERLEKRLEKVRKVSGRETSFVAIVESVKRQH